MATTTTRLGLDKPDYADAADVAVLNQNFDDIDAAVGMRVVTSTTRPATPWNGQIIFETDTNYTLVWESAGAAWKQIGNAATVCTSSTRPASPLNGQLIYETDTNTAWIWNSTVSAWRQLGNSATACTSSTRPASPLNGQLIYETDTNKFLVYGGTTWQDVNFQSSPNFLINSGFDVWQRGTASVTTNGAYAADRWIIGSSAGTNAVTRSTDVPSEAGVTYSIQFAGTSTTNPRIRQRIEAIHAVSLAGKTVTLSFYAKSVSGSSAIKIDTAYPTSTADTFGTWASPTVTADQSALTVLPSGNASASWTRYAVTFTVNALATRGYQIDLYRETSAASSSTLFTGVQLELGSVATAFRRNQENIQAELAACQRYFYRMPAGVKGPGTYYGAAATDFFMASQLPVPMRANGIGSITSGFSASNFSVAAGATDRTGTALVVVTDNPNFIRIQVTTSVATSGHGGWLTGAGTIDVSAEL